MYKVSMRFICIKVFAACCFSFSLRITLSYNTRPCSVSVSARACRIVACRRVLTYGNSSPPCGSPRALGTAGSARPPVFGCTGRAAEPRRPSCVEPWLPGCRVLPGRVAGLPGPGCCRVFAGLPVLPGAGFAGSAARLRRCGGTSGCCRVLPGAAGCCRVAGVAGVAGFAGLLTVLLGRDCVFFCVKFQYVLVFEHCRVRPAARRVGGGGSNPEPHAVFFQTSLNFVVKMLLEPPTRRRRDSANHTSVRRSSDCAGSDR